jgi:hypothetical protein
MRRLAEAGNTPLAGQSGVLIGVISQRGRSLVSQDVPRDASHTRLRPAGWQHPNDAVRPLACKLANFIAPSDGAFHIAQARRVQSPANSERQDHQLPPRSPARSPRSLPAARPLRFSRRHLRCLRHARQRDAVPLHHTQGRRSLGSLRRQASGATFAFALGPKEKPRAEAGRDLKWLCEALASPAAPYSTAHVSGAMARRFEAPVFVLTAPYASAPRTAMAVGTAAAERGCRFNRRQSGGRQNPVSRCRSICPSAG